MTEATFGHLSPETLALFTDRYELSMMQEPCGRRGVADPPVLLPWSSLVDGVDARPASCGVPR